MFFRKEPEFSDDAIDKMRMLGAQSQKLKSIQERLRERDKAVFSRCIQAVTNKEDALAKIYADELSRIRGITDLLNKKMVFIECVSIRLETFVEFSSFVEDLKPVTEIVRDVTGILQKYLPQISQEIQMMNSSISDMLMTTKIDLSNAATIVSTETLQSEGVLKEVSSLLGQRLESQLPEPPVTLEAEVAEAGVLKEEPIALESGSGTGGVVPQEEVQASLDFFDEILLDYLKGTQGSLNVLKCSNDLNMSYEEIGRRLNRLKDLGKIRIEK